MLESDGVCMSSETLRTVFSESSNFTTLLLYYLNILSHFAVPRVGEHPGRSGGWRSAHPTPGAAPGETCYAPKRAPRFRAAEGGRARAGGGPGVPQPVRGE